MKNECNIVRDLLPLCIEDMASPDSAVFVGKHLETCEDCRREMSRLQTPDLPEQPAPDPAEAEELLALQEKIKRRNRLLATVTTIVTAVVVSVLLVSLIIYHLPQRKQVSMPVCSTAGEVSYLEIDVNYYRRLFSRPWVEGTVTFDGVVYQDSRSLWGPVNQGEERSYWDWDWYFGDSDSVHPGNLSFHKDDNDRIKAFYDCIQFFDLGDQNSFEYVVFNYSQYKANDVVKYFGPANSLEEARQLAEELGWHFD